MNKTDQLKRDIKFLEETYNNSLLPSGSKWSAVHKENLKSIVRADLDAKKVLLKKLVVDQAHRDRDIGIDSMHVDDVKGRVKYAVISIRVDEFKSMLSRFPDRTPVEGGNNNYEFTEIDVKNEKIGMVFCRCPDQGTLIAQTVTSDLIRDLNPEWIFLVGIAGGVPYSEYCLGDVIIANRLYDFSVTEALEGGQMSLDTRGGPMHKSVDNLIASLPAWEPRLEKWATQKFLTLKKPQENAPDDINSDKYYGPLEWRKNVKNNIQTHHPQGQKRGKTPKVFIGNNASSNTLVMDTTLVGKWKEAAKNTSTIEMELAGVYQAVRAENPNIKLIGIRGLSDIVGYKRDPNWTEFACQSSASFTAALIRSGTCK